LRRDPDHFGDEPLVLIYIAKRLKDALALEALLTERSVDYLIEVDNYTGGIIFRSERAGAFFYVREGERDSVAQVMRDAGYRPQADME
jgi:hypothetical protein